MNWKLVLPNTLNGTIKAEKNICKKGCNSMGCNCLIETKNIINKCEKGCNKNCCKLNQSKCYNGCKFNECKCMFNEKEKEKQFSFNQYIFSNLAVWESFYSANYLNILN